MGRVGIAQALEARADDRVRVRRPAGEGEEAAVHREGRARAWAAVGGGRRELDLCVVELQVLPSQELGNALRDQRVAEPFGFAKALPVVAPVRLEPARALEAGDVAEEGRELGHQSLKRPGPCRGLAFVRCVGAFCDGHGRHHTAATTPADLMPLYSPNSGGK